MKTILTREEFLDNLWRRSIGLKDTHVPEDYPSPNKVLAKQWCYEWERGMKSRMLMGAFRYGFVGTKKYGKRDLIKEIHRRIRLYDETGNLEYLFDAGNFVMLTYVQGKRKGRSVHMVDDGTHFNNKEDDG